MQEPFLFAPIVLDFDFLFLLFLCHSLHKFLHDLFPWIRIMCFLRTVEKNDLVVCIVHRFKSWNSWAFSYFRGFGLIILFRVLFCAIRI